MSISGFMSIQVIGNSKADDHRLRDTLDDGSCRVLRRLLG
jgi:hypothetical protein